MILDVDEFDYLFDVDAPEEPRIRTWQELLCEKENWQNLSKKEQLKVLESYDLNEDADLSEKVPSERLFESFNSETPCGSAYLALSDLKFEDAAKGILEFQEGPIIGSSFIGVKLVGGSSVLRELLKSFNLDSKISVKLYVEKVITDAQTNFVKNKIKELIDTNNDAQEMANALLRIESYIQLGEPEIRNYMQHMYYGRALACFPKESEEYKKIKADIKNKLKN